jgi:diguanylate cyclase (GGDEF)-like protein
MFAQAPTPPRSAHWVVPAYHRMRTLSCAYTLVFCGLHAWALQASAWVGAALVAQFLIYPHLLYWRARRAVDGLRAERQNLLLDIALWGVWSAALGFPPWITFTLFITAGVNHAITGGHRSLGPALLAWVLGLGVGWLAWGPPHGPPESAAVVSLCALGLVGYLLGVGQMAWQRNQTLRRLRQELRASEASLQAANEALRTRLLEIEQLQLQLQDQANRDSLTGLFNRRYLEATLRREQARCQREGQPMALLMLDIDHFKTINDTHGHQAGDEVLRRMSALLTAQSRQGDIPCRIGGEEFLLLLPGMAAAQALERAEQIRQAFAAGVDTADDASGSGSAPAAPATQATVSVGVAMFPEHGTSMDALMHSADAALYAVKRSGRNGVRLHGQSQPGSTSP